jgi:hypothetical protein
MNLAVRVSPAWLIALGMMAGLPAGAADPPIDDRSTPGTVVPSTGTTAAASSGPVSRGDSAACAALRKQYAQSQVCFGRYRLANGGLKPQAFKHCREIQDPAVKCGPAVVD